MALGVLKCDRSLRYHSCTRLILPLTRCTHGPLAAGAAVLKRGACFILQRASCIGSKPRAHERQASWHIHACTLDQLDSAWLSLAKIERLCVLCEVQ
eukprot:1156850-Pelagomonas_calceolata.AAC.6